MRHWLRRQSIAYKRAYAGMLAYVTGQISAARNRLVGGGEVAEIGSVIDIVVAKESKKGEGAFLPDVELIDEMGTVRRSTGAGCSPVALLTCETPSSSLSPARRQRRPPFAGC